MRYLRLEAGLRLRTTAVFIHGLMGYSFSWRHNLDFFAKRREVCAPDLLGMGYSDRPEPGEADFGLSAAADRLLDFLRSLRYPPFDLIATAHGGASAMLAASRDRSASRPVIRRLALIAPANPYMSDGSLHRAMVENPFGRMFLQGMVSAGLAHGQSLEAEDRTVSPESGRKLREHFRQVQYVVLPNVGHLPYEEAPEEFNRCLLQFLAD
jgi:pimeloyl-ACP methyl ester carboxylesterase